MPVKPKFNHVVILSVFLLAGIVLSVVRIVFATAPNPGHNFTEIGGGAVQGDILYASAADTLAALAKNATASRYLSNSGTSNNPAWAQVDLTNGVTGGLPAGNGGTGQTSYTVGDVLYASASTTISKLAAVAAGSYLRSAGTSTAPVWSTITIPNAATQGDVWYSSASNVISALAAGTSGQFLKTLGGGANPAWATLGGVAAISATSGAINTTETSIVSYAVPANTLAVGSTFRITASGTATSSAANVSHLKIYIGSGAAGTTTNQALAVDVAPTAATSGTNIPFSVDFLVTVRATGAGGTASILGSGQLVNNGATGITSAATGNVVVQTTTAATGTNFATTGTNNLYLDYVSAASTTTATFYNAEIELLKP